MNSLVSEKIIQRWLSIGNQAIKLNVWFDDECEYSKCEIIIGEKSFTFEGRNSGGNEYPLFDDLKTLVLEVEQEMILLEKEHGF